MIQQGFGVEIILFFTQVHLFSFTNIRTEQKRILTENWSTLKPHNTLYTTNVFTPSINQMVQSYWYTCMHTCRCTHHISDTFFLYKISTPKVVRVLSKRVTGMYKLTVSYLQITYQWQALSVSYHGTVYHGNLRSFIIKHRTLYNMTRMRWFFFPRQEIIDKHGLIDPHCPWWWGYKLTMDGFVSRDARRSVRQSHGGDLPRRP